FAIFNTITFGFNSFYSMHNLTARRYGTLIGLISTRLKMTKTLVFALIGQRKTASSRLAVFY
ncbi:hypothetical protein, partial [Neisseria gonorrhoeae]|uniref:hypothetical protein n=1 Tax=Neisseria gonorrhoeae TaxID=485 RepID=UPI001BC8E0F5